MGLATIKFKSKKYTTTKWSGGLSSFCALFVFAVLCPCLSLRWYCCIPFFWLVVVSPSLLVEWCSCPLLFFGWCCLPPPPVGGAAYLPTPFGWCCFHPLRLLVVLRCPSQLVGGATFPTFLFFFFLLNSDFNDIVMSIISNEIESTNEEKLTNSEKTRHDTTWLDTTRLTSPHLTSTHLTLPQLDSTQLNSTQLNSTQLNSHTHTPTPAPTHHTPTPTFFSFFALFFQALCVFGFFHKKTKKTPPMYFKKLLFCNFLFWNHVVLRF